MKLTRRYVFIPAMVILLGISCKTKKTVATEEIMPLSEETTGEETDEFEFTFPETEIGYDDAAGEELPEEAPVYKGAETRLHDLIHTRVRISFNWEKEQASGKATLDLQPYFHPTKELKLDARGMDFHRVALLQGKDTLNLKYVYDSSVITIELPRTYKRSEKYTVFLDYTAKPSEIKDAGGEAITGNKGLYFINADGKDKETPSQIWTQGETEQTSCWLPTIDAPNEKMTQEIWITVGDTMQTISNGKLVSSIKNKNGTRTDYWKMDLPHAPYLACMVVGQFHVEKAMWRNIPLTYYTDKKFASSTRTLFGNTPEMLEFFSKKLGYDYPWPKYDQVVVHRFVSGAMENTTITVHGDMLMLNTRELLDEDYEDVIAHELFHHWFGDLVTCKSWSNLPLNESFATYGEYLWREYKYGREEADRQLEKDMKSYMNEATGNKQVNLVRFDYERPDEMFDAHSYQKGGMVLHMLRKYVGDEVFFESLKRYLRAYEYKTVEMHDFRKIVEEVGGEDLYWFFDQWFYHAGHPNLSVIHYYQEETGEYSIEVSQEQDFSKTPVYHLPIDLLFDFGDSTYRERININTRQATFTWNLHAKPRYVSFDSEKMLVGVMDEMKSDEFWLNQLKYGKLYGERVTAIKYLSQIEDIEIVKEAVNVALADPYWKVKNEGMSLMNNLPNDYRAEFTDRLTDLATRHARSATRAGAFYSLSKIQTDGLQSYVESGLNDSSYMVNAAALTLLSKIDQNRAFLLCRELVESESDMVKYTALGILAESKENHMAVFTKLWNAEGGPDFYLLALMIRYLKNAEDPNIVVEGLQLMNSYEPSGEDDFLIILFISQGNSQIGSKYNNLKDQLEAEMANTTDPSRKTEIEQQLVQVKRVLNAVIRL